MQKSMILEVIKWRKSCKRNNYFLVFVYETVLEGVIKLQIPSLSLAASKNLLLPRGLKVMTSSVHEAVQKALK